MAVDRWQSYSRTLLSEDEWQNSTLDRVSLVRSLLRGRKEVCAVRWDGRNGRTGYSQGGILEWDQAAFALHCDGIIPRSLSRRNWRPKDDVQDLAVEVSEQIGQVRTKVADCRPGRTKTILFGASSPNR
jgi:hypothetical protein